MIKYEDVKNMSTEEYFNGNIFSIDAFNKKYRSNENETYVNSLKRVCDYIASCEDTDELKTYWSQRWFDEIFNDYWKPAGSIMQGAGVKKNVSMMNCTTISLPDDSLEGIIKYNLYRVAKIAAYREGLGVDVSKLRPRDAIINNASNIGQGIVHWMKLIDSMGYVVGQSGRRPAILLSVSCDHPDLEEFITVKSDFTKIQNANISVQATDYLYECAINDLDWTMTFELPAIEVGDKIYLNELWDDIRLMEGKDENGYYTISKASRPSQIIKKTKPAKEILMLISEYMLKYAEPGLQNIDTARYFSNSDAVGFPIIGTNACCVVDNTRVMTNKGWIEIKDIYNLIKSGEKLLAMSYNIENKIYEFKPILNAWQQRNDVTVELQIEQNDIIYNIECSSDHPILTKNRGYVEAISLTSTDDIIIF